ncbi:putative house-cleaning noncanonical NTP pyrophosphatase (MazG superfamily) [Paenibacillus phyllosphaerae]|uniref:Putative house-cleaning noncanonical NTP pyrophosphatase (MazG superfamily) n=1 Tax=Paenibacillus phyllosphaerae TaxID=274593 RepID=A0A7W5B5X6_9BACL|nr:nucleoside triphosphate pyrophosphohydrolase [Paenibacillus phyllosphaerae]MBB3114556.1 putative house-cleaning noncanonical NTP pyrophosphatase (MazG superfamily) [Paenibacillus phyllosphaerae]
MPVYNKLVRDKIPQVIEATGKSCRTRILGQEEYLLALNTKLKEEAAEYHDASDDASALEELADMLEVIRGLAAARGSSWEQLEAIRKRKADARGGFQEKVFLIDVDEA